MNDPTHNSLDAAILDQQVAGVFHGKSYAYVAVVDDSGWSLGIAVAEEPGYSPIHSDTFKWEKRDDAEEFADGMNFHIGLNPNQASSIVVSTIGAQNRVRNY